MPRVAKWVDDLRAAFGQAYIDGAIRAGMKGQPVFWASENGHEIGTRPRSLEHVQAPVDNSTKDRTR